MNCHVCRRSLNPDSRYCDFCGTKIPEEVGQSFESNTLDINFLLKGILISIFITVLISFIAKGLGLPIIFGGLFLPFFFRRKPKNI